MAEQRDKKQSKENQPNDGSIQNKQEEKKHNQIPTNNCTLEHLNTSGQFIQTTLDSELRLHTQEIHTPIRSVSSRVKTVLVNDHTSKQTVQVPILGEDLHDTSIMKRRTNLQSDNIKQKHEKSIFSNFQQENQHFTFQNECHAIPTDRSDKLIQLNSGERKKNDYEKQNYIESSPHFLDNSNQQDQVAYETMKNKQTFSTETQLLKL